MYSQLLNRFQSGQLRSLKLLITLRPLGRHAVSFLAGMNDINNINTAAGDGRDTATGCVDSRNDYYSEGGSCTDSTGHARRKKLALLKQVHARATWATVTLFFYQYA
jgi:hypothetical protein